MLKLLSELCRLDGVSGNEGDVRDFLQKRAERYADEVRADRLGNLIAFKRGTKPSKNKLMLCTHMDEMGVIVTRVTSEGFLKFDFVGDVERRAAIGKPVLLGPEKVPGVIGCKAIHLVGKDERKSIPKTESFYIDTGGVPVPQGTYGAFVCEPESFGQGMFKAKAIDSRIGCAVMLKLLEEELPLDVTFAFTVQKEVGARGAFGAAFSVSPEIALVLGGVSAADLPGLEKHRQICAPGKGAVLSSLDRNTIYDLGLFDRLRGLAVAHDIPWQALGDSADGTDAQAIQRSKTGVRAAAISAAVRYSHMPVNVGNLDDFENVLKLTRLFLEDIAEHGTV